MSETNRSYPLDFVKLAATVLIVFHHYQQVIGGSFRYVNFYNGRFYYGLVVELFFVLSGFFMLRYVEKIKEGLSFRSFFAKRYFRLMPMLAVTAICCGALMLVYRRVTTGGLAGAGKTLLGTLASALGFAEAWTFFTNTPAVNNPTWYVSVLLLCYLAFYWLCRLAKKLRISPIVLFAAPIALGVCIKLFGIELPLLNGTCARGYYAFFTGLLLAHALERKRPAWPVYIACAAVIAALTVLIYKKSALVQNGTEYVMTFVYYPAVVMLFTSPLAERVFRLKIFGTLGRISFNVFVWHAVLLELLKLLIKLGAVPSDCKTFPAMLVFTACAFAWGAVSYFFIERPITKRIDKKHFAKLPEDRK